MEVPGYPRLGRCMTHRVDPEMARAVVPSLLRERFAHLQFGTTHPFLDGHDRLGRLSIPFLICECGAWRQPILYLGLFQFQSGSCDPSMRVFRPAIEQEGVPPRYIGDGALLGLTTWFLKPGILPAGNPG